MLYNRNTAQQKIKKSIAERNSGELSAMLIIDVDDFKHINDTFGHMFGDMVLQRIADGLQRIVRSHDIVSRIGGDEFLIYMKQIPIKEIAFQRAYKVIEVLKDLHWQGVDNCNLCCSIGIAFCPDHGMTYETLFQCADLALYEMKSQGKKGYKMFDSSLESRLGMAQVQVAANTLIDSESTSSHKYSVIEDEVFRCIYESKDFEKTISEILDMLGRYFSVSRVYIFESTSDGKVGQNTFEWCNVGITSCRDTYQYMMYSQGDGNYIDSFDEDGIFYCSNPAELPKWQRDVLLPRLFKTVVQCAISKDGEFRGFIGFDDCLLQRVWMKEQIGTMAHISKMISEFIMKHRETQIVELHKENLQMILDNEGVWVYVITPQSYTLLFANRLLHRDVGDITIGNTCFRELFHRNIPCDNCPLSRLSTNDSHTATVYNDVAQKWVSLHMTSIQWQEKEQVIITGQDMTLPPKSE